MFNEDKVNEFVNEVGRATDEVLNDKDSQNDSFEDKAVKAFYKDRRKEHRDSFPRNENGRIIRFNENNRDKYGEFARLAVKEFDLAVKNKIGDLILSDYGYDTISIMRNDLLSKANNLHNMSDIDKNTGEFRSNKDIINTMSYVIKATIYGNEKQIGLIQRLESAVKRPYFLADSETLEEMKRNLETKLSIVEKNIENRDFSSYSNKKDPEQEAYKHKDNIEKKIENVDKTTQAINLNGIVKDDKPLFNNQGYQNNQNNNENSNINDLGEKIIDNQTQDNDSRIRKNH
ncbi:hypothetical protein E3U40_10030 [Campylobacter fetus subsp. venerealis]|uniref:hypothetical protein n=1 Tax=Campylobacter fetus TaxID=196 RepID=UPI0003D8071D|nr:hypothetical protein [Campylobacter fetus]AHE95140.1 hypothetical protein CFVI03293_A0013 [Campylobacter fetus subsp. venerealis cfvi03/293]KAA3682617.1 hypothetical protein E3U40_10030 [Campylobacter fetus subsp. venerealis]